MFRSDRLAQKNEFEGNLGSDEKRKNRGGQRREHTDSDFRLSEARFRRGNDEIAECGKLRTAPNCGAIHNGEDWFGSLQDASKDRVERIDHLENALRSVFAHVDAAAEHFAGGIKNDELDVVTLGDEGDAVGKLAEHRFVEKVVLRAIQGHAGDAGFDAMLDELKILRLAALGLGANLNSATNGWTGWHGGSPWERAIQASKSMLARGNGEAGAGLEGSDQSVRW